MINGNKKCQRREHRDLFEARCQDTTHASNVGRSNSNRKAGASMQVFVQKQFYLFYEDSFWSQSTNDLIKAKSGILLMMFQSLCRLSTIKGIFRTPLV